MNTKQISTEQFNNLFKAAIEIGITPSKITTLLKSVELQSVGKSTTCDFQINQAQSSIAKSNTTQKHKFELVQKLLAEVA